MKALFVGLALAGVVGAAAPLDAQVVVGNRPSASRNDDYGNTSGQWYSVGRDASGYSIYERRTRDRYGNIVVQRARRNSNGSMTIISTRTIRDDRGNRNCDYSRSTNSVGDILFGRTNDRDCDDDYSRDDHGWYQVGRGANNNSIYERRTRDRNGNLIIQRARRNRNGTLTIISTRRYSDNDKQWKREQRQERREDRREDKRDRREDRREDRQDRRDDRRDNR
jgi:hypothetical protein